MKRCVILWLIAVVCFGVAELAKAEGTKGDVEKDQQRIPVCVSPHDLYDIAERYAPWIAKLWSDPPPDFQTGLLQLRAKAARPWEIFVQFKDGCMVGAAIQKRGD